MKIKAVFKFFGRLIGGIFITIFQLFRSFVRLYKKILHPRNLFHYDNIFAMGTLLLFFYSLSNINFEIINPISQAFEDVELTDIFFSNDRLEKNKDLRVGGKDNLMKLDTNITLINTAELNRYDIAELLNFINSYEPKVVALDIFFSEPKVDFLDSTLELALSKTRNLVLVSELDSLNEFMKPGFENQNRFTKEFGSLDRFTRHGTCGFANMMTDLRSEHMKICREYIYQATNVYTKDTIYSWPIEIVRKFKPEVLEKTFERNKRIEIIDYVGNVYLQKELLPYNANANKVWEKPYFQVIDYSQIFYKMSGDTSRKIDIDFKAMLKDKIILLGYLGKRIDIAETGEDLFYSPLNEKYVGKAHKDMFGIVIHANIISAMLRESYIDKTNDNWMSVVGFLTLYLVFAAYRPIYDDHKVWYDGLTKFMGIAISLILLGLIGTVFDIFNYQITFGAIWFGGILLAGDWLEIYFGLIKTFVEKIKENTHVKS